MKAAEIKQPQHSITIDVCHLLRNLHPVRNNGRVNTCKTLQTFPSLFLRSYMKD